MAIAISHADKARLIFTELASVAPAGLSRWDLQAATGLTWGQFNFGVARLKDTLQVGNKQPLRVFYNQATSQWEYALPEEWAEEEGYLMYRCQVMLSHLRRLEQTTEASCMKWGRTGRRRAIHRTVHYFKETMEDIVNGTMPTVP